MARTNIHREMAFQKNPDQIKWDMDLKPAGDTVPTAEDLRAEAEANRERSEVILLPNSLAGNKDVFDDSEPYSREQSVNILRGWGLKDEIIVKVLRLSETGTSKIRIFITVDRWLSKDEPIDSMQADKLSTLATICESLDEIFSGDAKAITDWFTEPHKHLGKKSPLKYIESNPKGGLGQISMTLWLDKNNIERKR